MRFRTVAFSVALFGAAVPACVPLQQLTTAAAPTTFNQSLIAAYVSIAGIQNLTADLYSRGRISRVDAQKVLDQTIAVRSVLELAAANKDAATLEAATQALIQLEQQVKARQYD